MKGVALLVCLTLFLFQWYTLNDVKSGQVHLILEWVPTVSKTVRLDQVSPYLHLSPTSFSLTLFIQTFLKHGLLKCTKDSSLLNEAVESHSNNTGNIIHIAALLSGLTGCAPCYRYCSSSLSSLIRTKLSPLLLCSLSMWREHIHYL